ncbi:MAG: universal stress protein [Lautropia sp.]
MYTRILVPFDGSETAQRGLDEAIALAGVHHARLRLVQVLDIHPPSREARVAALQAAGDRAIAAGIETEVAALDPFDGALADQIIGEARRWSAGLIVAGTHGRKGFNRLALGADAERIARGSPVPVLLVPARAD